ncbi:MAG: RtcB family protein, partial [Duodenibacillus sp.]|nr:RtcB family protein [Duodenibacillus sp.]
KQRAHAQLGTSGHGNHFVEFGRLTVERDVDEPSFKLKAGSYAALLSHSGSRGLGKAVADHYSAVARSLHPDLPEELRHLAWLELGSPEGREYWAAMELLGRYAAACHEIIHSQVLGHLGVSPLAHVENHHNFAWKETHGGEELIVHRKGATPAGAGVLGVVPGSMASPAYVVRGKGNPASFCSCSHGAGRRMSRAEAFRTIGWEDVRAQLAGRGVKLISGTLDESPSAYKDIGAVMAAQADLVDCLARFDPLIVKMAGDEDGRPAAARRRKAGARPRP